MAQNKPSAIFDTTDKKPTKVDDGFRNFAAKLGVSPQGEIGNNLLSKGHYNFNLVTRNRVQLEAAYRGSWIVGQVIDTIAKDMTREGIQITTNEDPENVDVVQAGLRRLKFWSSACDTIKWGRLYGGACGVMQVRGQEDLSIPIDIEKVQKGDFLGLAVYDRWQLYPALDKLINSGPDIGLPEYYDIVLGSNLNDPGMEPGGQQTTNANGRVRVHHSRCLRNIGIQLPFWQAITEMMWGESVLERMWDRLIEFDTATSSAGGLIFRAQLRTVGIDGLREILAAGGEAQEALVAQFEYMRQFQDNEGITLLDKNDVFASTAYSFAGLSDMLIQFGQQVSGSAEIPLVRLFGQSPAGMNATGDSDIRLYYDGILAKQEADMRNFIEKALKVAWRSFTGQDAPGDLEFQFVPLWQMSAIDKANIAKLNTDTIIEAHDAGAISTAVMMKELKQSSGESGLFTHITDEEIDEAENEEPPMPEAEAPAPEASPAGTPGEGPAEPKAPALIKKSGDSAWSKIRKWLSRDQVTVKIVPPAPAKKPVKRMTADQKKIKDFLHG